MKRGRSRSTRAILKMSENLGGRHQIMNENIKFVESDKRRK